MMSGNNQHDRVVRCLEDKAGPGVARTENHLTGPALPATKQTA
jgi:hypothetical protein